MKTITAALFFLLLVAGYILEGQNSYNVLFKTDDHEEITHVFYENEERFIAVLNRMPTSGRTVEKIYSFNISDKNDTLQWPFKLVRGDTSLFLDCVVKDNNQNIIFGGNCYIYDNQNTKIENLLWFAKFDQNRNIIWYKTLNMPTLFAEYSDYFFPSMIFTKQTNILFAITRIKHLPAMKTAHFFVFLNSEGDTIRTRTKTDIAPSERIESLIYNYDSSRFLLSVSNHHSFPNTDYTDGCLILDTLSLEETGSFAFSQDYNWEDITSIFDAGLTAQGDLIVAGDGTAGYPSGVYLNVFKYDSNYNITKIANLTNPDTTINPGWAENISINNSGEICVTGSFDNALGLFPPSYCWVYIAKLDTGLNILNERYYGGDASYDVCSITTTDDGGIVVGGYRYDYLTNGSNEGDAFIYKTDADLWVGNTDHSDDFKIHSAIIYPNPCNNYVILRTTIINSTLKIFDISGNEVFKKRIDKIKTIINIKILQKGMYNWILLKNNKIIDNGKFIKY